MAFASVGRSMTAAATAYVEFRAVRMAEMSVRAVHQMVRDKLPPACTAKFARTTPKPLPAAEAISSNLGAAWAAARKAVADAQFNMAATVRGADPEAIAVRLAALVSTDAEHLRETSPECHALLVGIVDDLAKAVGGDVADALRAFAETLDPSDNREQLDMDI